MKKKARVVAKLAVTVLVFWALLRHQIQVDGDSISVWQALTTHLAQLNGRTLVLFLALAAGIKALGILCSMVRWHLLLIGQGIRFNFGHVAGAFLIGRFLGTFLPSTIGLDSYKLYDAAQHSGRVAAPAAATGVEKLLGLSGIFVAFLCLAPFGYTVLPEAQRGLLWLVVPVAVAFVAGVFVLLSRPALCDWLSAARPVAKRPKLKAVVSAAAAYRGASRILALAFALSFGVHFFTAVMYYFTAQAVGAAHAGFAEVAFASSIQIFATVMSPFTIAGEGVRELMQALLLAKRIGLTESVLSAALGFWAAEALTLLGGIFWWLRRSGYRPREMVLR